MSEIVEVKNSVQARDIGIITEEIHELCRQAQATACAYIVEIGRRLVEAKASLGHGEWGTWLRDSVGFSQSTANNYMKIFEEYGASQMTIFGAVANSQTIGNLPYSKALALLSVPADERESFVKKVGAEDLSVKELEKAIRERDEERRRADELAERAGEVDKARAEVKAAGAKAEELEKKLAAAEKKLAAEKAQNDKLRAEASERKPEVVTKTVVADSPELDKLRNDLEEAHRAQRDAEHKRDDAVQKLKEAEQKLKVSDPDVNTFKVLFEGLQAQAAKCNQQLEKIRKVNPEVADKLAGALTAFWRSKA
jgi:hypothetical protein